MGTGRKRSRGCVAEPRAVGSWAVVNEKRVQESLNELASAASGSFLIVSSGDHYVQFIREEDTIHCEAVSNNYLAEKLQLGDRANQKLVELGFEAPAGKTENYKREYSIREVSDRTGQVSKLAVRVMSEIYDVSKNADLAIGLTVEGE